MDHLHWLMLLQQTEWPDDLPATAGMRAAAEADRQAAPAATVRGPDDRMTAVAALSAALEQAGRARLPRSREQERPENGKSAAATTQTVVRAGGVAGDVASRLVVGPSMEEISRFFERDARRFG